MKFVPMLAHIIVDDERNRFGLWLPLFLVWLLLLALLLALLPIIVIAVIVLLVMGLSAWAWRTVTAFFGVLCALRGLKVDVSTGRNKVFVSVV